METKSIQLDEAVYERIKARKRDDETVSEAIDRLTQRTRWWSLQAAIRTRMPSDTENCSIETVTKKPERMI